MGWTISWEDFRTYVQRFLTISEEINDGWIWHGDQVHSVALYREQCELQIPQSFKPNAEHVSAYCFYRSNLLGPI